MMTVVGMRVTHRYRLSGLWLALLLMSGCVSAPQRPDGSRQQTEIHFVENRSVDLAVRQDFDAAIKLLQQEQYAQGIERLKKVILASQNNSAPYINIAIAYTRLGDVVSAEKNLQRALEINPKHPVALNEYAMVYRVTGRYTEAQQLYERLLNDYPEFMPARKNLGILCDLYLNDAPCALAQYEIYSAAHPKDEDVKIWITGLKR